MRTKERPICLIIRGTLDKEEVVGLCEQVRPLLAYIEPECLTCDVTDLASDAVSVDALARLQLLAKPYGREIRLRHAHEDLKGLIELMGLTEFLPADD